MSLIIKVVFFSVLVQVSIVSQASCSFIDIQQPILIRDINVGNSSFGYSITATSSPIPGGLSSIYIGAPKGNDSKGLETGIVWECKLELSNSDSIYCTVLPDLHGPQKSRYTECCSPQNQNQQCYKEITDKMWFGSSITATNNRNEFISCGYRWSTEEYASNSRRLNGICYHASISETNDRGGTSVLKSVKRLKPPLHPDDQLTPLANHQSDHLWFYGEFGFSSVFEPKRNILLLGAPGHFHWKGTVIIYHGLHNSPVDLPCPRSYSTTSWDSTGETMDYLGYAVTTGNYYLEHEFVFAAGAPRGRSSSFLTGYVNILRVSPTSQISLIEPIVGNQFGSYFGSVLASADVNGDGCQELIVGAPLYSLKDSSESFDEGSVFIYTTKGTTRRRLQYVEKLSGDSGGRFGSAITNMGDINQDGFEDIAISAPASLSGSGEVYIFYGHPNRLSDNLENRVKIYAGDVSKDLNGFGSSLFGRVDIDGNGTPDLLIGSYTSKQLAVYRTRPRLAINVQINSYIINKQKIEKFRREETEFSINSCIFIQRQPDLDGTLKLWVEITADSDKAGTERFQFVESNKRNILFSVDTSKGQCSALQTRVKIAGDLQPTDNKEITFQWKVWYNDTLNQAKDIRRFDISGTQAGKVVPARRKFCSYCPAPTVMEYKHSIPLANDNCDSDGNPNCASDLSISTRFIEDSKKLNEGSLRNDYVIGSEEFRILEVDVTNSRETAYGPTFELIVKFQSNETAKNVQVLLFEQHQGCYLQSKTLHELERKMHYNCEVPLHLGKSMVLKFKLTFGKLKAMPLQEKIKFEISVYPQLYPQQLKTSSLELTLISDFKLQFTNSKNEPRSAISLSNSNTDQSFINSYNIANPGLSPLESVKVIFQIPVNRTVEGKQERVLRIAEPRPKELSCSTTDPMGFAIFDNNVISIAESDNKVTSDSTVPMISRRRKRRLSEKTEPGASKSKSITARGQTVNIGCEVPSNWKCVTVTCIITIPLQAKKPMNIDLRLAFVSQIANKLIPEDAKEIIVKTSGEASVFNDQRFTQKAVASTRLELILDKGLPAWLIFVSGVGGLILFLLMTFCLFKCGFFRRKTKEELQALKTRAEQEEILAQNFPNMEQNEEDND